ncbi:conserved Plasmodium protein, unknown function [Plasmodium relictum]|uniref:Uncharacterized protein n=1 Tax=Plasmodium relictum TaxID=85471 RepID=A0A1J1H5P7_PLARL|nr:conserved Plasmodium protein, unknown function [Plasmodium relictum]CRG98748.1 conserved Plasmodium protein, unknown function [Plasmodium relictum]
MHKVKLSIFYVIFLYQFILTYTYSTTKTNENGNILSTDIPSKNIRSDLKNLNSDVKAKKENNSIKIRKNMNKLFNTLFPNDIESQNEKNNFDNKYEKGNLEDNIYRKNISSHKMDLNEKEVSIKSDTLKNTKLFSNEMKIEYIKNGNEATLNKQNAFGVFGNGEKMKSESRFAIFNYLKDFFQNSSYMKNFRNFIEIFFNKYDQRILESTVFFNFDETLF